MKVMKFGGTSVGSPQRMKDVASLVCKSGRNMIVLSAMSGTTNSLVEIAGYMSSGNAEAAKDIIGRLADKYRKHIQELYSSKEWADKALAYVEEVFRYIAGFSNNPVTTREEKAIIAQGELLSTHMMTYYLQECGVKVALVPALEYMLIDRNGEPDQKFIREHLLPLVENSSEAEIFITQGFICRNADGDIDNLLRGGSDYSASLAGAALGVEEIQIWTDIDGMHNNDPRVVEGTKPVRHLHFEEAAELGYFGAKILHPTCIRPAKEANIPVRLLNSMQPEAPGTLIDNEHDHCGIKAVAAKDNITVITIKSSRMLLAYGFLRKVFEIFEECRTSIDVVCTSEVGVSMSIDNTSQLDGIVSRLKKYGSVTVERDLCIICVVGDMEWGNVGFETKVMDAMREIPVKMISFGGSDYNISFLVRQSDKERSLRSLSKNLFD